MKKPELLEGLGIVLLAAGESSRLGQPKQLIPVQGESLVRRTARRLLGLKPASLIVVTGCASTAVKEQLAGLPVNVMYNPDWRNGMGASIAFGVSNLPKEVKGALIMLCDQWGVTQEDLKRLFEVWITDISSIAIASWNIDNANIYGPPAIFPRNLFRELICLTKDQGAKRVIGKYRDRTTFVLMENASLDLDEPVDLKRID
jgi:molybdenum cofactor cytidylyltransferase